MIITDTLDRFQQIDPIFYARKVKVYLVWARRRKGWVVRRHLHEVIFVAK